MTKLFLDLDGVLADFDAWHERIIGYRPNKDTHPANWQRLAQHRGFYASMPPTPECAVLWAHCERHNPTILTGLPRSVPNSENDKRAWVAKHLGPDVPVVCCWSREKWKAIEQPGDVLVDDWPKHKDAWTLRGGVWITHTGAASTISQLQKAGFA